MGILGRLHPIGHKLDRALPATEGTQRESLGDIRTLRSFVEECLPVCVAELLLGSVSGLLVLLSMCPEK